MNKTIIKTWSLGYPKAKEKARKIYSKIGRIKCPALNDEYISFSRKGFDHLTHRGRIPRTRSEQKRRFVLLKYAENIVKNPKAIILYREKKLKRKTGRTNKYGKNILIDSKAKFWTFVENIDSCKIKIVTMQINNGVKKFWSIMGDNVTSRPAKKVKNTKKSPKK